MFTDAYRGRGVSRLMCTCALTLSLFMFLFYGVLFYLKKFNPSFIQKGCVCQKWLFFSNEINFCCNEISFFYFKLLFQTKVSQTVLILIKQNLRYTLNFRVTPTLKKSCIAQHRDLFERLFYIDIYRVCFILLLLLLILLLNVTAVAVS